MHTFTLQFAPKVKSSEILISHHLLDNPLLLEKLYSIAPQIVVVYDDKIDKRLIETIQACLYLPMRVSEPMKSRESKAFIENTLLEHKIGKDTLLIAIGGGVISDLVGFVAATYLRGVHFAILPTTLLSMVDACVGGKTAVNTSAYKNCIGTFYPADLIAIDINFLISLPEEDLISGMAEVIKYGLIESPFLLHGLQKNYSLFQKRDPAFFEQIIHNSLQIKTLIVEQDPEEKGIRRILNFGHTIGHALEILYQHQISHGEAIAIGMCMESYVSYVRGNLTLDDLEIIYSLFEQYGFCLSLSSIITKESLIDVMEMDKKACDGNIRFVLLESLGATAFCEGDYVSSITAQEVQLALEWFQILGKSHALTHH